MEDVKLLTNMLTVREVSQLLHVHPNTLRRWSDAGRLKAYRITPRGDRRYRRDDVVSLLEECNKQNGNHNGIPISVLTRSTR